MARTPRVDEEVYVDHVKRMNTLSAYLFIHASSVTEPLCLPIFTFLGNVDEILFP